MTKVETRKFDVGGVVLIRRPGHSGKPAPHERCQAAPVDQWLETLETRPDSYMGETYMGPWG